MPAYRPNSGPLSGPSTALYVYQACLEEGKCTPIAAVARATWLASLLLLPRSVNSSYCSNYGNLTSFLVTSCRRHAQQKKNENDIQLLFNMVYSRTHVFFIHLKKWTKRETQSQVP